MCSEATWYPDTGFIQKMLPRTTPNWYGLYNSREIVDLLIHCKWISRHCILQMRIQIIVTMYITLHICTLCVVCTIYYSTYNCYTYFKLYLVQNITWNKKETKNAKNINIHIYMCVLRIIIGNMSYIFSIFSFLFILSNTLYKRCNLKFI